MTKRNLTTTKVIQAYIELAAENELTAVTFPRLAEKLGVKSPSLYNHFKNLADLKLQTAIFLQQQLTLALTEALIGQAGENALLTYAITYRQFATQYAAVYELLNTVPSFNNADLAAAAQKNNDILAKLLASLQLPAADQLLVSRTFRSLLHGYISLHQLGYFQNQRLSADDSFMAMVKTFIVHAGDMTTKIK